MSMDYPLYEELRRRRHPAAKWWMIGDRLYYLGLLPGGMAFVALPILAVSGFLGFGWTWFWVALITFPCAVVSFLIGSSLKGYVHSVAEREGIKWY